jgi:hypothetical protein
MRTADRQIFRIAPALLVLAITLLQPVPEARADFDKRTEGFTYESPILDIIKEPAGLPDDMRSHGTRLELKESIIKGHSHDY